MKTCAVTRDDSDYPIQIDAYLGDVAPATVWVAGPRGVLRRPMLALLSSGRVPGSVLDRMVDAAQLLRRTGVTVVSGFHSPVERETLRVFLCSPHPIVVCWARGMPVRVPAALRGRFSAGGVLFATQFPEGMRRATRESCLFRNRFAASLAGGVFVVHARPGSKTWKLVQVLACRGMPVYTVDMPENRSLLELGARPLGDREVHPLPEGAAPPCPG